MYFEIVKSSSRHSVQFWPIFSLTLKKYLEKINYTTMNLVHGTKLKKKSCNTRQSEGEIGGNYIPCQGLSSSPVT